MKTPWTLLHDAWESFLLYLPLACLGVLALTTYWMVHSTPGSSAPSVQPSVHHTPDYFMEGFSVKTFAPSGHIRSEITGTRARHFPDTEWLEIDNIRIRSIDDKGHITTASANRGMTNEDGSQVQLLNNARVVHLGDPSSPGVAPVPIEYRGEFLHAFLTTEQIKSNKPVEITHGIDHFTADTLDYDNIDQVLRMEGRVRGLIGVPAKKPH